MGSNSTRETGTLPALLFFCADDCDVGRVLAVKVGEMVGRVRSAGFIVRRRLPGEVHGGWCRYATTGGCRRSDAGGGVLRQVACNDALYMFAVHDDAVLRANRTGRLWKEE